MIEYKENGVLVVDNDEEYNEIYTQERNRNSTGQIFDKNKVIRLANQEYTCPSCGYKTISGSWDICDICFWEWDECEKMADPVVYINRGKYVITHWVEIACGPNKVSLRQAQKNFKLFGGSEKRTLEYTRKPIKDDIRDKNWKPMGKKKNVSKKERREAIIQHHLSEKRWNEMQNLQYEAEQS